MVDWPIHHEIIAIGFTGLATCKWDCTGLVMLSVMHE